MDDNTPYTIVWLSTAEECQPARLNIVHCENREGLAGALVQVSDRLFVVFQGRCREMSARLYNKPAVDLEVAKQ